MPTKESEPVIRIGSRVTRPMAGPKDTQAGTQAAHIALLAAARPDGRYSLMKTIGGEITKPAKAIGGHRLPAGGRLHIPLAPTTTT